jgi:hypothetical protein
MQLLLIVGPSTTQFSGAIGAGHGSGGFGPVGGAAPNPPYDGGFGQGPVGGAGPNAGFGQGPVGGTDPYNDGFDQGPVGGAGPNAGFGQGPTVGAGPVVGGPIGGGGPVPVDFSAPGLLLETAPTLALLAKRGYKVCMK